MNNNKLQEDLRELRRQAGYEPNAWYDQKEEEYLSQLLSDTEKRVRNETLKELELDLKLWSECLKHEGLNFSQVIAKLKEGVPDGK